MQLVVHGYKHLQGRQRRGHKLELSVVQRLGVRVGPFGKVAYRGWGDGGRDKGSDGEGKETEEAGKRKKRERKEKGKNNEKR